MLSLDVQKLEPDSQIYLYELNLEQQGGGTLRLHGHMQDTSIWWQGQQYDPVGIDVSGIGVRADGRQETPILTVANCINGVMGALSSLCIEYDDFKGVQLKIHRTLSTYLDPINFDDGINDTASDEEDVSIWYVE